MKENAKSSGLALHKTNQNLTLSGLTIRPLTMNSVKLLGLNISSDLKWNAHVSKLVRKLSIRLYFLRWLKKSHVATREILLFYTTCIQCTLEYSSPVFHRTLPSYLSEDQERLNRCIIHRMQIWQTTRTARD